MEQNNIDNAIIELFKKADEMYGDAIESFWFYEGESCPCCKKRKIDSLSMGKNLALSLNAFMYRELNTLIGYLLCNRCITDLLGKGDRQKNMYYSLEQNLKNAYHEYLKSQAS